MSVNLELLDLRAFLAIFDTSSFRKSASLLSLSHSALSRRVQRLETPAQGEPVRTIDAPRRSNRCRTEIRTCGAASGRRVRRFGDVDEREQRAEAQSGNRGFDWLRYLNTPLPVTDTIASHRVAFAKLLCASNLGDPCVTGVAGVVTPALPQSFGVPATTASGAAVQELVVKFVSGECVGVGRTTELAIFASSGALQVANTGDDFSSNRIPMSVAQFNDVPSANAVQSLAQQTQLTYSPGTTVSISFDFAKGGGMNCLAQLNGHFVTR